MARRPLSGISKKHVSLRPLYHEDTNHLLDPGNQNLLIGSLVVGTLSTVAVAVNLVDAGANLKRAGQLYKDHHLQLQVEATKNGTGMVMRF